MTQSSGQDPRRSLFGSLQDDGAGQWPCFATAESPEMLEFVLRDGARRAVPYAELLYCERSADQAAPGRESLAIHFPGVEVVVTGRGLGTVWEPLMQQRLSRLGVIDPARVFDAGGTVVDAIVVTDLG